MILQRQRRHCLFQYPEQGKARREEGGSGLTSWKRIKSSRTTKKGTEKNSLLDRDVCERTPTGEELQNMCKAARDMYLQKDTCPVSLSWAFPQPSSALPLPSRPLLHVSNSETHGIKSLLCILMHATIRALSWNRQRNSS